jgi:hypothetical protein
MMNIWSGWDARREAAEKAEKKAVAAARLEEKKIAANAKLHSKRSQRKRSSSEKNFRFGKNFQIRKRKIWFG